MKDLMTSVMKEMERYENEYNKKYDVAEIDKQHKRVIEEAATSYVSGILTATLFGFGADAHDELREAIEDMEYEFLNGQTITGKVL